MKIINCPVHGFIRVPDKRLLDLLNHPYMQRLRRIKQLGMTNLVYPGAEHTRFSHAVGAMHLMQMALETLKSKGAQITDEECFANLAAILMHDIGHGPFSHVLEHSIVQDVDHEHISEILMDRINTQMDGIFDGAINVFKGKCRPFLHQLISSQLDTDRLDYLMRDSFYSGVTEGKIGSERIIRMLALQGDDLVVEAKGIYSIEKFLIARRLMYWQVYLHKTVISAERMLIKILQRAKYLVRNGEELFGAPHLMFFLKNDVSASEFETPEVIARFCLLDDADIISAIKQWSLHSDPILGFLSRSFINRDIFHVELLREPVSPSRLAELRDRIQTQFGIDGADVQYFLLTGSVRSTTYDIDTDRIKILFSPTYAADISEASDMLNLSALQNVDKRHYLCFPRTIL